VDAILRPDEQEALEAAQISSIATLAELGSTFTVLGVPNPRAGGPVLRSVAECAADWAAGGGSERDQDGYHRGLAQAEDPDYQPELLFTPTRLTSSGYMLMDAVHRAAALFTKRTDKGATKLDLPVYVLPKPFPT